MYIDEFVAFLRNCVEGLHSGYTGRLNEKRVTSICL